jgi:hypothetical protein
MLSRKKEAVISGIFKQPDQNSRRHQTAAVGFAARRV